mgnify:CR=1 FL=1
MPNDAETEENQVVPLKTRGRKADAPAEQPEQQIEIPPAKPSRPMLAGYEADQREVLARVEREVTSLDSEIEVIRQNAMAEIEAITRDAEKRMAELAELKRDRLAVGSGIRLLLVQLQETPPPIEAPSLLGRGSINLGEHAQPEQ